jgi:RNA polymerase sigma-70 factor (ECF subfamily)
METFDLSIGYREHTAGASAEDPRVVQLPLPYAHHDRVDPSGTVAIFDAFVRTNHVSLYRRALRLTGNESEAADLVQDTLEKGMRRLPRGMDVADVGAWLHAIMRNLFVDRRRAYERRYGTNLTDEAISTLRSPEPEEPPEWSPLKDSLRNVIEELESGLRSVMMLKVDEGLSQLEIAARLDLPPATVGTRVFRAKKKLRVLLNDRLAALDARVCRGASAA